MRKRICLLFDSLLSIIVGFVAARYAVPEEFRDIGNTPIGESAVVKWTVQPPYGCL